MKKTLFYFFTLCFICWAYFFLKIRFQKIEKHRHFRNDYRIIQILRSNVNNARNTFVNKCFPGAFGSQSYYGRLHVQIVARVRSLHSYFKKQARTHVSVSHLYRIIIRCMSKFLWCRHVMAWRNMRAYVCVFVCFVHVCVCTYRHWCPSCPAAI